MARRRRRRPRPEEVAPTCPECGELAELGPHPHVERFGPVWACAPCDARVGTYADNVTPLGTLAGPELRAARRRAHAAFDPIWKAGPGSRFDAYAWLADALGLAFELTHIARFDLATCARVVELARTHPNHPDHRSEA